MDIPTVPVPEGVAIISCDTGLPPENIIRSIIGKEELPSAVSYSSIQGYSWNFDTKYYSAEVCLYALEKQEKLDTELSKAIKAVVLYIDNTESKSLEDAKSWMPYLENVEAEVQIIICNDLQEDSKGKKSLINWCVQNEFELVELNTIGDEEGEGSCNDVYGYERVRQSLQAHYWTNLNMKDDVPTPLGRKKSGDESLITEGCSQAEGGSDSIAGATSNTENTNGAESGKKSKKVQVRNEELDLEEQLLARVLSGEDDGESFEALFTKFASMKDRANGLNGEDRKKYAEEVAMAFWKAIGGDEDEIAGLEDD